MPAMVPSAGPGAKCNVIGVMFVGTNRSQVVTNGQRLLRRLDVGRGAADSACMTRRVPSIPLLLAIATAFGVSSTVQVLLLGAVRGDPKEMVGHLFVLNMVYWYVPALLAPVIMALALRVQPGRVSWPVAVIVHIGGALAFALLHTAALLATNRLLMPAPKRGLWYAARIEFLTQLDWLLMSYLFLVGLALVLAYRRESESRALAAARLETRLVEAQLQALQRQLHPHFLFNTLNTISGLMRTDVNAADRMMDGLAELLRATLHSSGTQEVTLLDELQLLQKYVDIEKTRFGARLTVHIRIDPEALDASVPVLLLQPLVENAVKHGIAPRAAPGVIEVSAHRVGDRLSIAVRDTGLGVPGDRLALLNGGIGLSNTRSRLQHLYPDRHGFVFANVEGGFCVTVTIPFSVGRSLATEVVQTGAA
jgi:two-component system, LytTR family, sensor kinase